MQPRTAGEMFRSHRAPKNRHSFGWAWGLVALICLATAGFDVRAESIQPLEAIEQAVASHLQQQSMGEGAAPRITVGRVDPRLRLAACDVPLQAFTPPGQRLLGATTVGVRCVGGVAWTVYVQAEVALLKQVLITRQPLSRGTVLTAAAVDAQERDVSRMTSGYLVDIKDVDGMLLKHSVRAGTVLHRGLLQHPVSIRRGERVTILGKVDGIEVRMEGQALMDGVKGEPIRVRNLSSGREIEAVVVSQGLVQVNL